MQGIAGIVVKHALLYTQFNQSEKKSKYSSHQISQIWPANESDQHIRLVFFRLLQVWHLYFEDWSLFHNEITHWTQYGSWERGWESWDRLRKHTHGSQCWYVCIWCCWIHLEMLLSKYSTRDKQSQYWSTHYPSTHNEYPDRIQSSVYTLPWYFHGMTMAAQHYVEATRQRSLQSACTYQVRNRNGVLSCILFALQCRQVALRHLTLNYCTFISSSLVQGGLAPSSILKRWPHTNNEQTTLHYTKSTISGWIPASKRLASNPFGCSKSYCQVSDTQSVYYSHVHVFTTSNPVISLVRNMRIRNTILAGKMFRQRASHHLKKLTQSILHTERMSQLQSSQAKSMLQYNWQPLLKNVVLCIVCPMSDDGLKRVRVR